MTCRILALFPIGVVALRSGSSHDFMYQWLLQARESCRFTHMNTILPLTTIDCYLNKPAPFDRSSKHRSHVKRHDEGSVTSVVMFTMHLEGVLMSFVLAQILLRWWYHVIFKRIRTRTWASYAHIWLGRPRYNWRFHESVYWYGVSKLQQGSHQFCISAHGFGGAGNYVLDKS